MRSSLYQQPSLPALVTVWPWEMVNPNGRCHHGSQDQKRGWGVKNKMARACRYFVVCTAAYQPKTRFRSRWPPWPHLMNSPWQGSIRLVNLCSLSVLLGVCRLALITVSQFLDFNLSSTIRTILLTSGRTCWHQDELTLAWGSVSVSLYRTARLCHGCLYDCTVFGMYSVALL